MYGSSGMGWNEAVERWRYNIYKNKYKTRKVKGKGKEIKMHTYLLMLADLNKMEHDLAPQNSHGSMSNPTYI